MKNLKIILFVIIVQCILSCNRPHITACFTVNKSTANVGDTITFTNCSDYKGWWSAVTYWYLGDTTIINNGENIQHVYSAAGQYLVEFKIGGEKQCYVAQTKRITIQ